MFGEKTKEYSVKQRQEIPVWQSPKYEESKAKAMELIKSKKYNLDESDFWILMNETKSGKMAYSGLIISHNGCLKINDKLPEEKKFDADSVIWDKDGYGQSLVCIYQNGAQGIFEVGEVSTANCKNAYPYAMALKRCMDRVILKSSKIAFSGIYSESESDDFKRTYDEGYDAKPKKTKKTESDDLFDSMKELSDELIKNRCQDCGCEVNDKCVEWSRTHLKGGAVFCKECLPKHSDKYTEDYIVQLKAKEEAKKRRTA